MRTCRSCAFQGVDKAYNFFQVPVRRLGRRLEWSHRCLAILASSYASRLDSCPASRPEGTVYALGCTRSSCVAEQAGRTHLYSSSPPQPPRRPRQNRSADLAALGCDADGSWIRRQTMVVDEAPGRPGAMQARSAEAEGPPIPATAATQRPRYLIVVSREQPDLWRHLRQMFTGIGGVDVVLDRRHAGRWQWVQSRAYEERGDDRRRPPLSDAGLSHRSFVIVQPDEPAVSPPAA